MTTAARPADPPTVMDVQAARSALAGHVRRTPVVTVELPSSAGAVPLTLKLESLQVTGSFKPRGAVTSLLELQAPEVVACSGGNHGLAVAWAAHRLGRRATVVVPTSAAATKVTAMRELGAHVIQTGDVPAEAFEVAEQVVADHGWPLVHPYDQPATIAGQGTLGLELADDAPDVTHWLIAVGGGGLAAGVALALTAAPGEQRAVIPVEPQGCPSLHEAQHAGRPVPTQAEGIARTSLGPPSIGDLPWLLLRERVGPCVLVSDADIATAQQWLWRHVRVATEPGGATALAGLLAGRWAPPPGATVGVVVCGGNTDALPP
ncbi:MAG: serine/threonine dehydratase [Angustibacter sp.]